LVLSNFAKIGTKLSMRNILARPIQGHLMVPAMSAPSYDGHMLCGHQNIAGAVSPNSGRRLLQLAQINTSDPRLELASANFEVLPLLYSWTCDIHHGTFTYRVGRGAVALLDFQRGQAYSNFPYDNYPDSFPPLSMELSPISATDQQIILELNDRDAACASPHRRTFLDAPRHQVGGIPRLMQDEEFSFNCPVCTGEMPFLASIADDNGTPRGFTGNAYIQVVYHLCRACWVVTAYNICD
jgi:hypothetical protein